MKRPLLVWLAFAACLTVVVGVLAFLTRTTLALQAAQREAKRAAAFEENVRLALWRMDSALAPLIAAESAQPYFAYTAFYPAERAYPRMFQAVGRHELLMPSPLLAPGNPDVLLHAQLGPDGIWRSPQVPLGEQRALAEVRGFLSEAAIDAALARLESFAARVDARWLRARVPVPRAGPAPGALVPLAVERPSYQDLKGYGQQQAKNAAEWQMRSRGSANAKQRPINRALPGNVREGVLVPLWAQGLLLFARRVAVDDQEYLQVAWLDWPHVRAGLLDDIADLLPGASLGPAARGSDAAADPGATKTTAPALALPQPLDDATAAGDRTRRLAALPVRLAPGVNAVTTDESPAPWRVSLIIAWVGVLLAALAVGSLLKGAMTLSARRGDFVSAVTHELRTPLTTFRLYTDMLASGMVTDAEKRDRYLNTLRTEANRLGHLVENVLAYARLERRRVAGRAEQLEVGALFACFTDRLTERAAQAALTLEVDFRDVSGPDAPAVLADPAAVEQIVFNLVDNAAKYAASATDRRVTITVGRTPGSRKSVAVVVRDRGPGIAAAQRARLFRPFSKSAAQAAHTAHGVGLGLALSRRLARQMGGDLKLVASVTDGAAFSLVLPATVRS